MKRYFITGIGTEVGKTVGSAIITEALEADYWKPIQAGDLQISDSMAVESLIQNNRSVFHKEAYRLNHPISPHASAERDGLEIDLSTIKVPNTDNILVIEGAGGLLAPLNRRETMIDLIDQIKCEVILISRHYLGSINHTLMSTKILKTKNIAIKGILFNGNENKETEEIIKEMSSGIRILGRINELKQVNSLNIKSEANRLKESLSEFI
ncbi:MAG: dethiobiotin synthase [Flavobacteriales bacterium]|nr:dethiobiotin synthase [Flavobacteriales bacterium]